VWQLGDRINNLTFFSIAYTIRIKDSLESILQASLGGLCAHL
jgi:hypothetical protein